MATPQREKAWMDFRIWCVARGLRPLPAHPWTVAAYVRFCEGRHRSKTITGKVQTIIRAHVLGGHASPEKSIILKRTLKCVMGSAPTPAAPARSLFAAKDFVGAGDKEKTGKAPSKKVKKRLPVEPRLSRKRP